MKVFKFHAKYLETLHSSAQINTRSTKKKTPNKKTKPENRNLKTSYCSRGPDKDEELNQLSLNTQKHPKAVKQCPKNEALLASCSRGSVLHLLSKLLSWVLTDVQDVSILAYKRSRQ